MIGGITEDDIVQAVELSRAMKADGVKMGMPGVYADGCVSTKVVKIIQA